MWAIGFVERPNAEYQIIRYKDLDSACSALAELMGMKGPYNTADILTSVRFLIWMGEQSEADFDKHNEELAFCQLDDIVFVIGKFENMTHENNEAPFRVIQDHRECTDDFCFGDMASRN